MSSSASCDGGGVKSDCRKSPGGGDGERESELNGELGTSSREEESMLERGDESPDSML